MKGLGRCLNGSCGTQRASYTFKVQRSSVQKGRLYDARKKQKGVVVVMLLVVVVEVVLVVVAVVVMMVVVMIVD